MLVELATMQHRLRDSWQLLYRILNNAWLAEHTTPTPGPPHDAGVDEVWEHYATNRSANMVMRTEATLPPPGIFSLTRSTLDALMGCLDIGWLNDDAMDAATTTYQVRQTVKLTDCQHDTSNTNNGLVMFLGASSWVAGMFTALNCTSTSSPAH
jgi:hypothetical protein